MPPGWAEVDTNSTVDSVSVDFGDGTPPARGVTVPFTATHTYPAEGTYTVTARARGDDGRDIVWGWGRECAGR